MLVLEVGREGKGGVGAVCGAVRSANCSSASPDGIGKGSAGRFLASAVPVSPRRRSLLDLDLYFVRPSITKTKQKGPRHQVPTSFHLLSYITSKINSPFALHQRHHSCDFNLLPPVSLTGLSASTAVQARSPAFEQAPRRPSARGCSFRCQPLVLKYSTGRNVKSISPAAITTQIWGYSSSFCAGPPF